MRTTIVFTLCLLILKTSARSDFRKDAKYLVRLLEITMNNMDQLSKCHETDSTIHEKRRCLAILGAISNSSIMQASVTNRPKRRMSQCRPFHRWAC